MSESEKLLEFILNLTPEQAEKLIKNLLTLTSSLEEPWQLFPPGQI